MVCCNRDIRCTSKCNGVLNVYGIDAREHKPIRDQAMEHNKGAADNDTELDSRNGRECHEGTRVGSNLEVHACSSFKLGAASA